MATIIENLKKILEARYGKDVRQAIHDSIENCYNDGKAGSIDLQARNDIEEIGTKIETVESIAKGKNKARVFSTTESMGNWLSDSANKGVANVGDNLYIVAVDVPDWWISSVLEAPNESGMYYEIAQLETQKVDLTTIESAINSIDSKIGSTDISAIGDGTVTGGLDSLNSNLTTKVEKNELNGILYLFKDWRGWSDGTHVLVEQPNPPYCLIHIQNDNASELLSFSKIGSPELHHIAGDVIATNYITNGYTIQFDIPTYTQVMMYTIKTNL